MYRAYVIFLLTNATGTLRLVYIELFSGRALRRQNAHSRVVGPRRVARLRATGAREYIVVAGPRRGERATEINHGPDVESASHWSPPPTKTRLN